MAVAGLLIAQFEEATGVPRATLRVWEQRYGFPRARRNAAGLRVYSGKDVEVVRLAGTLVRRGMRPGRLLALPAADIRRLALQAGPAEQVRVRGDPLLGLIHAHDIAGVRAHLRARLGRLGVHRFLDELAAVLEAIGVGWECGEVGVFEEHAFVECTQGVVREALGGMPEARPRAPRVLLATLSGEQHGLGLLFVQATLAAVGWNCISLGVNVPAAEIARAAQAYRCQVIAVSCSCAVSGRKLMAQLGLLAKAAAAQGCEFWAGGSNPALQRAPAPWVWIGTLAGLRDHAAAAARPARAGSKVVQRATIPP